MIRYDWLIGEVYGLGVPKKPTQVMRQIDEYLKGDNNLSCYHKGWCLPSFSKFYTRNIQSVADHTDFFKNDIVYIPYLKEEDAHKEISESVRWQLALSCGMSFTVKKSDPRIFENPVFADDTCVVIVHVEDWIELRWDICSALRRECLERPVYDRRGRAF